MISTIPLKGGGTGRRESGSVGILSSALFRQWAAMLAGASMKARTPMKQQSNENSLSIFVCSSTACWLVAAAAAQAGDLLQLKPPPEQTWASGSISNTVGQPIVWTNHLSLRVEPSGERTWVAGYVTNAAEQEKVWTNRFSQAAESGDADAQVSLALYLHDGRHGFPTNRVQAYKWAAVAAAHGHYKAKRLVDEWQASMSPKDVAAGKAAAAAFTPRDKKKQD